MSDTCNSAPQGMPEPPKPNFQVPSNENSNICHVIAIMSGKGGVGKSLVTSLLASRVSAAGYRVGILDADITGPSIPKAFGVDGQSLHSRENLMVPAETESGIKIVSSNLLLDDDTEPLIWRGPMIASVVKQFWTDVYWGDVDYLFVDMPPGTGDVPLTVFQSLPVEGIVVVTSPQELVSMIVEKAVNMARQMDVPILGLVENLSYYNCPDCGKPHAVFGESHIDEVAAGNGLKVLAKAPIDSAIAAAVDAGKVETLTAPWLDEAVAAVTGDKKAE